MAKYIQRIALLGKERWIGWEIDGVGTEVAGLMLADELSPEELRARGVKEFHPLDFETFLGMNPEAGKAAALLDEDIDFRLDALQVGMERIRGRGEIAVPRSVLTHIFGSEEQLEHPRVQKRLLEWALSGAVELVRSDDCYLRIVGPF